MPKKENLVDLLKILSDDTRLNIIMQLSTGEKCVCEITDNLKLPQNLVSHHLGILRKSGLIKDRRQGKWIHYSLDKKNIKRLKKFFANILSTNEKASKC